MTKQQALRKIAARAVAQGTEELRPPGHYYLSDADALDAVAERMIANPHKNYTKAAEEVTRQAAEASRSVKERAELAETNRRNLAITRAKEYVAKHHPNVRGVWIEPHQPNYYLVRSDAERTGQNILFVEVRDFFGCGGEIHVTVQVNNKTLCDFAFRANE